MATGKINTGSRASYYKGLADGESAGIAVGRSQIIDWQADGDITPADVRIRKVGYSADNTKVVGTLDVEAEKEASYDNGYTEGIAVGRSQIIDGQADANGSPEDVRKGVIVYTAGNERIVGTLAPTSHGTGKYRARTIDPIKGVVDIQYFNEPYTYAPAAHPTHDLLTADGYTHTVEELTGLEQDIDVGLQYKTTDGATYAFVSITKASGRSLPVYITKTGTGTVSIDWGDGIISTFSGTTQTHTYANYGDYRIRIWVSSGSATYSLGASSNIFVGGTAVGYKQTLICCYIGDNVTEVGSLAFSGCPSLNSVIIPQGVTTIGPTPFDNCYALASVVAPRGLLSIGSTAFYVCSSLRCIALPNSLSAIGTYAFSSCPSLDAIVIPKGVTAISASAFSGCNSLGRVVFHQATTTIDASAFNACQAVKYYEVQSITPPSVSGSFPLRSITKIYVPDASLAAYKAATNWAAMANYIYPVSEKPAA